MDTQRRLIEAASDVFAESGYRNATLREICGRASANIAAVNYHFRDKEGLYAAVIEHAIAVAEQGMPQVSSSPDRPAEEKLEQFIHDVLESLLGAGRPARVLKLMSNEMIEPTPALDLVVEKVGRPISMALQGIVEQLLGPGCDAERVRDAASSVMAQCVSYHHSAAVIERLHQYSVHDPEMIRHMAKHVTQFSLGGIRALAQGGRTSPSMSGCPVPAGQTG